MTLFLLFALGCATSDYLAASHPEFTGYDVIICVVTDDPGIRTNHFLSVAQVGGTDLLSSVTELPLSEDASAGNNAWCGKQHLFAEVDGQAVNVRALSNLYTIDKIQVWFPVRSVGNGIPHFDGTEVTPHACHNTWNNVDLCGTIDALYDPLAGVWRFNVIGEVAGTDAIPTVLLPWQQFRE